ncbi:MAG TPA: response regulator transcription factor [Saprospiraceae bacterium]|nr:response regulator transcription factor [Saprospiraceae bacterium]HPI04781.1 response regulator transcription factor [Saprospiraceae bacterium]
MMAPYLCHVKILLIEDEPMLATSIQDFLQTEGYLVEHAADFPSAEEKVTLYEYDCLVVDVNLPGGGTGLDVIRNLKKQHPDTGVIIVSARDALDDRITGLDLGADDYLTKPFHLPELNARLKAILRRRQFGGNKQIEFGDIKVNPDQREVFVHERPLSLTPKEYDLLLYFLANQHRVLRREIIAEHLLGDDVDQMDDFNFIYSHVKNLRKKLLAYGSADYIKMIYSIGYKFTDRSP